MQTIEAMREGPPEVPIDHIAGNVQPSGDLVGLKPLQAMEDEDDPPTHRKLSDRAAQDTKPRLDIDGKIGCRCVGRNGKGLDLGPREQALFELLSSRTVEAKVDRRTAEEGTQRLLPPENLRLLGKLDVEVVNDVGRRAARMATATHGGLDVRIMGFDCTIQQIVVIDGDGMRHDSCSGQECPALPSRR